MINKARRKNKEEGREIAFERIEILFGLADKSALSGDLDLADDYVVKARKIAMKFNVRLGRYKRRYCKYCYKYLLPGKTFRVRTNPAEKRVEVTCLRCGRKIFFPYVREVKAKRRSKIKPVKTK